MIHCCAKLFGAVAQFAAEEDEVRTYLRGVLIEPHETQGVYLVASDGHRMLYGYDPDGFASEPSIRPIIPNLLKACRSKNAYKILFNESYGVVMPNVDDWLAMRPSVLSGMYRAEAIEEIYADWRKIASMQVDGENERRFFMVNATYLAEFAEVMKYLPELDSGGLSFSTKGGPNSAIHVAFSAFQGRLKGMLMPMSASHTLNPATRPDWFVNRSAA